MLYAKFQDKVNELILASTHMEGEIIRQECFRILLFQWRMFGTTKCA